MAQEGASSNQLLSNQLLQTWKRADMGNISNIVSLTGQYTTGRKGSREGLELVTMQLCSLIKAPTTCPVRDEDFNQLSGRNG